MSSRAAFWASTLREVKFVLYTFNNHLFLHESKQKWGKFLMIKKQKIILLIDDFHFTIKHYSYLRQRRRITSVPYWLPSCRHVLWRRGWTSWLPIEYCSFLRRPSSKRRYPCLNFWLKSRWEAWTGVELSKMTSAFFSVCRWEKIMKNKFKICNSDRKEVSLWPFGIAWKPTREKFSLSIKQVKIFLFSWSDHT